MKTPKFLLLIMIGGIFALSMNSCADCKNQEPRARILNNGTKKASVQIKTSGGNTVNINNVDPGTASPFASYAPGEITFTIVVDNVNYVKVVQLVNCFDYDIAIDANNNITLVGVDRN